MFCETLVGSEKLCACQATWDWYLTKIIIRRDVSDAITFIDFATEMLGPNSQKLEINLSKT